MEEFLFNPCFRESSSTLFFTVIHVFFEMAQVYLRLAGCRVYEGHLQNEQ